jgi:hypothetical protein
MGANKTNVDDRDEDKIVSKLTPHETSGILAEWPGNRPSDHCRRHENADLNRGSTF